MAVKKTLTEKNQMKTAPSLPKKNLVYEQLSTGKVIYRGKVLDTREINDIMSLARGLSDNHLLVDLIEYIENEAAKKIYHDSKTLEDISFGKGMLSSLDLLKRKIINITKIKT